MSESDQVVHIVLVQWRPTTPPSVHTEITALVDRFPSLVPGVLSAVEGPSVSPEGLEGEFDWGLVVTFADAAARDVYLDHPAHAPVAEIIGGWCERVVVFDLAA